MILKCVFVCKAGFSPRNPCAANEGNVNVSLRTVSVTVINSWLDGVIVENRFYEELNKKKIKSERVSHAGSYALKMCKYY